MAVVMEVSSPSTWQEKLKDECRRRNYSQPVWNIISDRRGGRTAWSSTVDINGQQTAARYWYDGQYMENAKEDAAEVGWTRLMNPSISKGIRLSMAAEEEKVEPEEEPLPEGAIGRVGEDILD